MKIFSYGSNMSTPRLAARVPSARFVRTGYVVGFTLRFHKRGRLDGSAKADMLRTGDASDRVWGVIWDIDPAHKPDLDRAEGLGAGYEEERVRVIRAHDGAVSDPRVPGASPTVQDPDPGTGDPGQEEDGAGARSGGAFDEAWAYLASPDFIDDGLVPFGWYVDFVVAGAREHALPDGYVDTIVARERRRDPDRERRMRNRRILEAAREGNRMPSSSGEVKIGETGG